LKRRKKRTAEKSKIEYERAWLKLYALIRRAEESGLGDPVEILNYIQEHEIRDFFSKKHFYDIHKKIGLPVRPKQPPEDRLAVQDGDYIIAPIDHSINNNINDLLARFLTETDERIDYVVEFGSGIGRNLFILADKLEPQLRANIGFYACEFTDAGRKACAELRELNSNLNMSIESFDYYHPDFSFLGQEKNILFFTRHSIEQIPILNRAFFDGILKASNKCFCYHAEPVGWQYDNELLKWRRLWQSNKSIRSQSSVRRRLQKVKRKLYKLDRYIFERFDIGFLDASRRFGLDIDRRDIGRSSKVSLNAARWSAASDYNTNLVCLLKDLEKEGLIRIDFEQINFYGDNPFNPSTIVVWHKA
jgi:hypothetical protein